jgi:two-component system response regulator NreC
MTEPDAIQVVIVEDHPALRRGFEMLLARQGFRVTGSTGTVEEGARMIGARRPSVALIDIELADGSGTDLAKRLLAEAPETASVLCTGFLDEHRIDEAVHSGALGIVLKTAPVEELVAAIRSAADGATYVDPRAMAILARRPASTRSISVREAEVLGLLAGGLSCKGAAQELSLAVTTVQTHVRNASRKLGARGQLHAVVLALRGGDLELSEDLAVAGRH